jgi:hypothetical protein
VAAHRAAIAEALLVGALFIAVWYALATFFWTSMYRHTDTTQLVTITESTGRYGVPYNSFGASVVEAVRTWGTDAQTVCNMLLAPGPGAYPNGLFNYLEYHAYYFVYVLAPLTFVLPASGVVALTQALAMAAVPLLVYVMLRYEHVHPIGAIALVLVVAAYPVWNGALIQDLYMDRYFPPLALAYAAVLYYSLVEPRRPWAGRWIWAIPLGVLAASTNDRSILYVIGLTLGIVALMGRAAICDRRKPALALAGFTCLLVGAFLFYQTHIHTSDLNTIPDAVGRGTAILDQLRSPALFRWDQTYGQLALKFLLVNALFVGIWGVFRWQLLLLALGAMLPNIITSVGGAEKITFGIEYHAEYLPLVLFATALGFSRVWRSIRSPASRVGLIAITCGMAACLLTLVPEKPGLVFTADQLQQSGLSGVWGFYRDGDAGPIVAHRRQLDQVAAALPPSVTVTAIDNLSPALYTEPGLYYYPIGIDTADYAVVSIEKDPTGKTYYGGAVSYTGEEQTLNECLTQRLKRDGYDVDNPLTVGPYAILKRG